MEALSDPLLWLTLAIMLIGLAGSMRPGLPDVPLIFLSALVYAILTHFEVVGTLIIVLLGVFPGVALVADFVATTYGAHRFGTSNWGTAGGGIGGIVGALVGALFLGIGALFGRILGTVGGVFLGEYLKRERGSASEPTPAQTERWDWKRDSRAAGGAFVGYVVSAITQGVLGLLSVIVIVLALYN